jgi:hypothetical protein
MTTTEAETTTIVERGDIQMKERMDTLGVHDRPESPNHGIRTLTKVLPGQEGSGALATQQLVIVERPDRGPREPQVPMLKATSPQMR